MKAKSRRRLLISSVAMLLVAMLALGTATFAWFTNSTTARANGLTMTASASKGLEVTTNGTTWGTNQTWAAPSSGQDVFLPFSVPYTVASAFPSAGFYTNKAGVDGAWEANSGYDYEFASQTIAAPSGFTNYSSNGSVYYLAYKVNARVKGAATTDTYALTAKIERTSTATDNLTDVIRIALVNAADSKVIAVMGDDAIKPVASVDSSTKLPTLAANDSAVVAEGAAIACGNISGQENDAAGREFYVYVWIEGQDTECLDAIQGFTDAYRITFSIPANSFNS